MLPFSCSVFSQDGVQRRSGEWSYSIPDALGREVLRGTCKTLGGANLAQSLLDGKTLVARYDGSSGDAGYAVLLDGQAVELAGGRFLSAQYYDSYDFLSRSEFSELGFENDPNYGKRYTGGDKSLHTGSIRTSLSPQQTVRMPEAYYYDLHGRLVQCNGRNHLGGKDRYLARYDFTGRPVQTRESHSSSASGSQRGLTTTLAYDHDGRLSSQRLALSSATIPMTTNYSYDEAGRLSEKTLGSTPVSYAYNVRGWIGKIASAPFVSELRYENPRYGGAPLYSGMVSQWTWKHGQQPENDYVFSYDGVGRLVAAKHFVDGARTDGYTERGIRYDANGNLLSISRTAGGAVSDSLRFTLGGDVLLDVSGTSTGVFEYDPSGNLVKDGLNRLEFSYNCLNLMQTVQTTVGASKAQFTYGSDGRKLSEKARTGGFEYLGSLIYAYRGGTLSLAQAVTDEGTIQSAGVNYFIRDHLGSVRAVVDHTGKIVERNDYYPFGGRHENSALSLSATNRYKFGGKETLEPVSLDMLDFGARFYDPRIARWNTQDPLAEKYFSLSPYNYCAGNPITLVDPTGMFMTDYFNLNGKKVRHVDDNKTDRYLVLTTSSQESIVDQTIEAGGMIDVPTNDMVALMSEIYDRMEQTGLEYGFRVGEKGTLSRIVEGKSGELSFNDWLPAMKDLVDQGDRVVLDAHGHPLKKDENGNIISVGTPKPSPVDKENVVGCQPNIVLGYQQQQFPVHNTFPTQFETKTVRYIGFFNRDQVFSPIEFSKFRNSIFKINKQR
ncbi:RHS repeat domain-containing protein [Alistipes ihumii]|uniref:RHS repeat-associated core domain-containing protein n=2 Tax=Alistipes ihumii TaxID=1470347 RepID=A0ABY5UZQ7_9BACT|nr:RHS repeat-associated core domain-containing protein [Alistipes ihumii]UWN56701.1 RHS repeat-associated core domain-containing protein [Alistipes ihumii AP11]